MNVNYKTGRRYCNDNLKEEIAREIAECPKKTYSDIADKFCISVATVRRIAKVYGVARYYCAG